MNLPISIRGARQHNLRNLDLDLPSNKLIAFCGPSGSGKSSLAFDTLFSESRRRFLDCLSARSRQGMDQPEKPEVDSITGLPPALCLEQSARQQSSRTLLGSITKTCCPRTPQQRLATSSGRASYGFTGTEKCGILKK